jgi:hypothetical protein
MTVAVQKARLVWLRAGLPASSLSAKWSRPSCGKRRDNCYPRQILSLAKSIEKKTQPGKAITPPDFDTSYQPPGFGVFKNRNDLSPYCNHVSHRAANPQTVPDCGPGFQSLRSPSRPNNRASRPFGFNPFRGNHRRQLHSRRGRAPALPARGKRRRVRLKASPSARAETLAHPRRRKGRSLPRPSPPWRSSHPCCTAKTHYPKPRTLASVTSC